MGDLRIVIVDDEPLALDHLEVLLAQISQTHIIGRFTAASEAIEVISALDADLVLLDVEMPKLDGFDVVEAIARRTPTMSAPPLVCFVTAYPRFAAEAFDTGALDFLCKPVRLSRLEKTVARAREALHRHAASRRLDELLGQLETLRARIPPDDHQRLWIPQGRDTICLGIDDIVWIQAEGEYVRIHMSDRSYLVRRSISALAEDLIDAGFHRVHRSTIVNQSAIISIRSNRGGMQVILSGGVQLPIGRKFRSAVRELIGRRGYHSTPNVA